MKLLNEKTLESLRAQGKKLKFVADPQGILVIIEDKEGLKSYGQAPGGDPFLEEMERAFEEALRKSNVS